MRLRTKYALLLLVIVVVLGGVVLGSTELAKGQVVAQEQADLQQTATVSAGQVQTELTQRLVRLENLGSDPDVTRDPSPGGIAALRANSWEPAQDGRAGRRVTPPVQEL